MAFLDDEGMNPVEFECPSCGERVYSEVLVCPNCGLHFFEDETTQQPEDKTGDRAAQESPGREVWGFVLAVITGWAVSAALAFVIQILSIRLWTDPTQHPLGQAALFIAGPLGALAGGYLAARIAQNRIFWLGLAVSILSLIPAYLIEAYWRNIAVEPLPPLTLISWAVLLLAGPFGAWLWHWLSTRNQLPVVPPRSEMQLYYDLLARVRHDMDTADRLIEYERKRYPLAARTALIRSAIDRIDRDRR